VDLRPASATYRVWYAIELFARGFQTLIDDAEISYQISEFYAPRAGNGYCYDDPAFAIIRSLLRSAKRDLSWPSFLVWPEEQLRSRF
jgi:dTDP-4-dehydrorhamnose 3,5-epimerase